MNKDLIVIVGPTCSGKSKLAVSLAKKISGEIVSADSRQIYKFLDIGTAKPSDDELKAVPHHMINIITPDKLYSAGEFENDAEKIIDDIFKRNKQVILAGGTGLYIKALLHGIFTPSEGNADRDDKIRKKYENIIEEKGTKILHDELKNIDPESAQKIHINDKVRIIRALEVYKQTGIPISKLQTEQKMPAKYKYKLFGLKTERKYLYEKINERVDKMMELGLLNEVKFLLEHGYNKDSPGLLGIGYKELLDFLDGKCSLEKAVELIKRNTRRYAKRQFTWFNHLSDVTWFEIKSDCNFEEIAEKIHGFL